MRLSTFKSMKRRRSVLRSISLRMTSNTSSSVLRSSVNPRACSDQNDQLCSLRGPSAVVPMCLLIAWVEVVPRHRALQPVVVTSLITQPRIDLLTNPQVLGLDRHHLLAESVSLPEQPLTIVAIGCEVMVRIRTVWSSVIGSTRQGTEFKRPEIDEHLRVGTSSPRPTPTTQRPSIVQVVRKEVASRVPAIVCTALQGVCV